MENPKQDITLNPAKWPGVRKIELPIKKIFSVENLQRTNDEEAHPDNAETNSTATSQEEIFNIKLEHKGEAAFCPFCSCKECIEYREVLLLLINDHIKTKNILDILKNIIKKLYLRIIDDAPPKVLETYERLLDDDQFCWLVSGVINMTKLPLVDYVSILSLSDNLVLLLFSTLLMVDDPHQFFEIISYQVECFAKAYAEGLTELTSKAPDGKLSAHDLINYVIKGYEGICRVAEKMSNFLFVFENSHLEKFALNWLLLNKRMYQKWVYSKFTETMPECILKLKEELAGENYTAVVRQYIKFDDDMMLVNKKWRDVWMSINVYNASECEQKRRERIRIVHNMFDSIRNDKCVPFTQFIDIPDWETHEDRQLVWQNMITYLRQKWPLANQVRLNAALSNDQCKKCSSPMEFHGKNCDCVTCLIAGGPSLPKTTVEIEKGLCSKCIYEEKAVNKECRNYVTQIISKCTKRPVTDPKLLKLDESDIKEMTFEDITALFGFRESTVDKNGYYHLAWAVFKHLKDRRPYPYASIDEKYFCSNCTNQSCLLAKKIINNELVFGLARQLMKHYQPIAIDREEMIELMPYLVLYTNKSTFNLVVYDPPNDDLVIKSFWAFIISASVHYYLDNSEEDLSQPQIHNLKIADNDIELPIEYLEQNQKSDYSMDVFDALKDVIKSEVTSSEPSPKPVEEAKPNNENQSPKKTVQKTPSIKNEVITSAKAGETSRETRETAEHPTKPKHGFQCCVDHADMVEHCMENHFNKMCFHEKECSHARINETRDRLRKKLNQLSNAKKNVKVINKTVTKSPLELIKTLNKNPPSLSSLSKEMAKMQNKANVSKEIGNKTVLKNLANLEKQSPEKKDFIQDILDSFKIDDERDVNTWLKDTLSFIEGGSEPKKSKTQPDNKKAAKKAKQKQKKEETKRIEELQELRAQFHDLYFKEFISKNDLKSQKSSKKKDKKKIVDLEGNIKKLNRAKSRIEGSILELISVVKSTNTDFKFSYLPTKEQQQQYTAEHNQRQLQLQQQMSESKTPTPTGNLTEKTVSKSNSTPLMHPEAVKANFNHQLPQDESSMDPSKRMVTIRRVNLPHVTEPQVTVTAKGASPDKDKLLYTFINGQLVPAASLDSQTLSVLQPDIFPQISQMQLSYKQEQQRQQQIQQAEENEITKTKTQLKKERKRAKKLQLEKDDEPDIEIEMPAVEVKAVTHDNNKPKRKNSKDDKISAPQLKKSSSTTTANKINSRESSLEGSTKPDNSKKSKSNKTNNCKPSKEIVESNSIPLTVATDTISEKRKNKVVDNGQFDNNQFKMLHMDAFSSDTEESDHEKLATTKSNQNANKIVKIPKPSSLSNSNGKPTADIRVPEKSSHQNSTARKQQGRPTPIETPPPVAVFAEHRSAKAEYSQGAAAATNKQNSKAKKSNKKTIQNEKDAKRYQRRESGSIDKTVLNAESVAKSLQDSMQKLHLNDTTIELAKNSLETPAAMMHLNVSIMDQLNRGVQVEDLALPPGITLTKVDPSRAEILKAKQESIGKLSQPMQVQPPPQHNMIPTPVISPALLPHFSQYGQDQSGVIMVDAMTKKQNSSALSTSSADNKKSKKNKRRNKKKKPEADNPSQAHPHPIITQNANEPKMITLRNPMFHGQSVRNSVLPISNRAPMAPLPMDQPAAIIKNENGMFTIRNPALHQAFSNGAMANAYRQFNPNYFTANDIAANNNLSFFSDPPPNVSGYNSNSMQSGGNNGNKMISAIGSEMKNAQQKKLANNWQANTNNCSPPNPSGCAYLSGINCSPMQQKYQQSNYYNGTGVGCFDVFNQNSSECGGMFNNTHHNCDDSPPPSIVGFNHYLEGIPNNGQKYEDMSFLRNLIPGQRLNSEVTIHNINESKFSRNNPSPISHGVEITPISCASSRSNDSVDTQPKSNSAKHYQDELNEFGDNLFAPNQMLNLNDLESDERDIECFKRFSYGFEPPKNKPKVNINVNDLLANSKKPTNSRSSPYLDESLESFVRNMNSLKIASENNAVNMCSNQAGAGNSGGGATTNNHWW